MTEKQYRNLDKSELDDLVENSDFGDIKREKVEDLCDDNLKYLMYECLEQARRYDVETYVTNLGISINPDNCNVVAEDVDTAIEAVKNAVTFSREDMLDVIAGWGSTAFTKEVESCYNNSGIYREKYNESIEEPNCNGNKTEIGLVSGQVVTLFNAEQYSIPSCYERFNCGTMGFNGYDEEGDEVSYEFRRDSVCYVKKRGHKY